VVGDWNGDEASKIGVYYAGTWWLDYNGNDVWDGSAVDNTSTFGSAGSVPVVGEEYTLQYKSIFKFCNNPIFFYTSPVMTWYSGAGATYRIPLNSSYVPL
jgi:hypothetical protein